jgi:hypothetical protein
MRNFPTVGIQIPEILFPQPGIDLEKWAVIACDQFTSQPEYWEKVRESVGNAPSTLNLILPEVYLGRDDENSLIQNANIKMQSYLLDGILQSFDGFIVVERTIGDHKRMGLMLALDLEKYDFNRGSQSLIRATEGTIIDRLPPRIKIRKNASIELPHILVLIDDPERTVIEPVLDHVRPNSPLYDFDLMMGSGHITGWKVQDPDLYEQIKTRLEFLAQPDVFQKKYRVGPERGILLFAVGDGNHSLATAKSVWELNKAVLGMDHPSRYALVELENLHDSALVFEPIHRVLTETHHEAVLAGLHNHFGARLRIENVPTMQEMIEKVRGQSGFSQRFGMISSEGDHVIEIMQPEANLPVGTLQAFIDNWLKSEPSVKIDYVHGNDVIESMCSQPGNVGFFLPAMSKSELFRTVILDGALPRKTFSMGEAKEKRFYLEARKISL